jgi:serine/threonine protein phosphatase 1
MAGRTFAIGDIHGQLDELQKLLRKFPKLDAEDTIVFLGDYLDRGPKSAEVVALVRHGLARAVPAKIVALCGSHEDAWLRVRREGWIEFVLPVGNGCLATLHSFRRETPSAEGELPTRPQLEALLSGAFFPDDVIEWLSSLPRWYEDEHAIYVHAGLPKIDGRWAHPSEVTDPKPLCWQRTEDFFKSYDGKRVVFGHTRTEYLPQELSAYTPHDTADLFYRDNLIGVDTGCGSEGFLTAIELPRLLVYESRKPAPP